LLLDFTWKIVVKTVCMCCALCQRVQW